MFTKTVFLWVLFVWSIRTVNSLECYQYLCRGEKCDEFQMASDKTKFMIKCSDTAIGCRHRRGDVTSMTYATSVPRMMEERGCWDPNVSPTTHRLNDCVKDDGPQSWVIEGDRVEVNIKGETCLCSGDLCNENVTPMTSTSGGKLIWEIRLNFVICVISIAVRSLFEM